MASQRHRLEDIRTCDANSTLVESFTADRIATMQAARYNLLRYRIRRLLSALRTQYGAGVGFSGTVSKYVGKNQMYLPSKDRPKG